MTPPAGDGEQPVPRLTEPRFSLSLERGLSILQAFTPERPVLAIGDVADELGISRSTTHLHMTTLLALGFLEQLPSREYRLGVAGVVRRPTL